MITFDKKNKQTVRTVVVQGAETEPKQILDCSMELLAMGYDSNGNFAYSVELDGQKKKCREIFTAAHINERAFADHLFALGFVFSGSKSDIPQIFLLLKTHKAADQKMLSFSRFSGRFTKKGYDLVVYRNGIYDIKAEKFYSYEDGKDVNMDDGTVVIVNGIPENIKLFPVYQEPKGEYVDMTPKGFYAKKIIPLWKKNPYSILLFGWYLGTLHIEDVLHHSQLGFYPLIFISGMAGEGKTQMLRMMNRMVGFDHEAQNWEVVSMFVEQSDAAFINSFPIHRDEYRGDGKLTEAKNGFIRSLYMRAGTPKGRSDLTTVLLPVNSTLVISGEGRPTDQAVKRRIVPFSFNISSKHAPEPYSKFLLDSLDWAQIMPAIYRRGKEVDWKKFPEKYTSYNKHLIDIRHGERFAILATIFDLFMGGDNNEVAIKQQLDQYMKIVDLEFAQGDHGDLFFESIHLYFLRKDYYVKKYDQKIIPASSYVRRTINGDIAVYMLGIFFMYQEQMKSTDTKDFKGIAEMRSIFKDKYHADPDHQRFAGSSGVLSCTTFPIGKCPKILITIVETIEAAEKASAQINYAEANGL